VRILLDTNVLLRLMSPADPEYLTVRAAVDAFADRGYELCFVPQNVVEFWNVCTRPADKNGFGLTVVETDARARLFERDFVLLPDTDRAHAAWRHLVISCGVSGVQVHDARLVAAMAVHGVQVLLTLNDRDFARYPGVVVAHPRAVPQNILDRDPSSGRS
jgi:predicted nucleic acid-binding protein